MKRIKRLPYPKRWRCTAYWDGEGTARYWLDCLRKSGHSGKHLSRAIDGYQVPWDNG